MERQKREINIIMIHFGFYFVLTIGLIVYLSTSIFPQILSLEETKKSTKELYNNLTRIEKSGLTFDEFKSLNSTGNKNVVISEILNSITNDFYTTNLVNTKESNYTKFLEKKVIDLNNSDNQKLVEEKINKISKVLPPYTDNSFEFSPFTLTDYKFVNYVESIIESFNLNSSSSIGIAKISLLDDYAISTGKSDSLQSNIYYIPLNLVLKGTKSSVIEFLFFIENVGNINIDKNNININNNYGFLSKNGIKKILEGDRLTSDYNIFEHQIVDIDKIVFNDYIDSSYISRGDTSFRDFIIKTQGKDQIEINVNLLFYVKGQPTYKLLEKINAILDIYNNTNLLIDKGLSNPKTEGVELVNLKKYKATIKQFSDETNNMRKSLIKKENMEEIYIRAVKIEEIITPIYNILNISK
ncbi:MAG: hypothetical protein Q8K30_02405 [Candidatus Gracilibacteria bacterium]|nr:hypothetical protein [Candidatus Gracilibacteria bacterium]